MPDETFTGLWLNEQVKRNRDRFPSDFLFQLTQEKKTRWPQIATTSKT
jgi:hypothetical protein